MELRVTPRTADAGSFQVLRSSLESDPDPSADRESVVVVKVITVSRSLRELLSIRDAVPHTRPFSNHFSSVLDWGPAAADDVVEVAVTSITKQMESDAKETYGDAIRLVVGRPSGGTATRLDDSSPWFGGIRINKAGGTYCSTGFPVQRGGARYLSTAGHCGPIGTTFTNSGTTVGSTALISYSTNGIDTALISSSSVGARVYTSCPTCSTSQPVKGSRLPSAGSFVCFSGSVTGEECGVTVGEANRCVNFTNVLDTCGLTRGTKFDPLRIISQGGDSGGPVYSYSSGGISAVGSIVGSCGTGCGWYLPIGRTTGAFGASLVIG